MKYSEYQPRPDLLKDRIILITGAGDGIGRAAALSYALHGATVVLHGRTLNKLEVIYDEIEGLGAPQPAILPLQLSTASSHDYELLVDTLEQQFGRLDGILHNAGMLGDRVELAHYPVDVWDDVMAVNLRAPFALTQALLPLLNKSEHASVRQRIPIQTFVLTALIQAVHVPQCVLKPTQRKTQKCFQHQIALCLLTFI